jgi:branched-chain amino acid transport system substrate-binding protein
VLRLAVIASVLVVAGCGVARTSSRAPAPETQAEPSVRATDRGAAPEARRLAGTGRLAEAESLLRGAIAAARNPKDRAASRLALAELLEDADRRDEALALHLESIAEGGEGAAAGWAGVARIRRAAGDEVGAVRAELRAFALSSDEGSRPDESLRRSLASLPPSGLRALWFEVPDPLAKARVRDELARRGEPPAGPAFPVALLAPLSGKLQQFGEAFRLGVQLALEDRDARAAAEHRAVAPVRLVERDTEGDLLTAAQAARAVLIEDGARAIIGPLLSVTTIAAGSVAESYGVPLIAPLATDPELSTIGRYVVTLDSPPEALAAPLGEFAVNVLGARRLGVLLPDDGVSAAYERAFEAAVRAAGGEVVVSLAFEPGETDFRKMIERVDREEVDALYVPGSASDLGALASQLDFYEFRRRILGHGAWTHPDVMTPGNRSLEGAVFSVAESEHPDSEFMISLGEKVRRRSAEDVSRFHVQGYRAMAALLLIVDRGARGGEEIVEALRLRRFWVEPPPGERIHLVTWRDGVLGPASWAGTFDLAPDSTASGGE